MKIAKRIGEDAKGIVGVNTFNHEELTEQERLRLGKQFAKDSKILLFVGLGGLVVATILSILNGKFFVILPLDLAGIVIGIAFWYISRPL